MLHKNVKRSSRGHKPGRLDWNRSGNSKSWTPGAHGEVREEMTRAVPVLPSRVHRNSWSGRSRVAEMESEQEEARKKALQVSVRAFPRSGWWARFVVAALGLHTTIMWGGKGAIMETSVEGARWGMSYHPI